MLRREMPSSREVHDGTPVSAISSSATICISKLSVVPNKQSACSLQQVHSFDYATVSLRQFLAAVPEFRPSKDLHGLFSLTLWSTAFANHMVIQVADAGLRPMRPMRPSDCSPSSASIQRRSRRVSVRCWCWRERPIRCSKSIPCMTAYVQTPRHPTMTAGATTVKH